MRIDALKMMFKKFNFYILQMSGRVSFGQQARYGIGVIYNFLLYNATISDYFELGFYKKRHCEKKEYLTSKQALYFAEHIDSPELLKKYNSKKIMYKALKPYIKREQLYTDECTPKDFDDFIEKHPKFLYKPDISDSGRGIEMWEKSSYPIEELYEKTVKNPAVLDEKIVQHPELSALNPSSVNTIRVFTLMVGEECKIIGAVLRMGNGTAVIDNYSAGGLVGSINTDTGCVIAEAEDFVGRRYAIHPLSKINIKGFKVPNWSLVLEFVRECASNYGLKYVAWDIAVREDDCVLIEANPNGMVNLIQIAGASGRKRQYEELKAEFDRYKIRSKDDGILYP